MDAATSVAASKAAAAAPVRRAILPVMRTEFPCPSKCPSSGAVKVPGQVSCGCPRWVPCGCPDVGYTFHLPMTADHSGPHFIDMHSPPADTLATPMAKLSSLHEHADDIAATTPPHCKGLG
ncbi:hypothetical protein GCM10010329_43050 [Streptomyces spiroverticillatus]|nr:hypothetical protein GCM10010329_43050 [Streptomyces spiroverticillatus]